MAHQVQIHTRVNFNTLPNGQTRVGGTSHGPHSLQNMGYNMLVELSTASAFLNSNPNARPVQRQSITVVAHFDTGATKTSIDASIAQHLGLIPTGQSTHRTASGQQTTFDYAVDMSFIGSSLKPFLNLRVGSCQLGFNLQQALTVPNDGRNLGLLIGRDVMANWNVTWHGPTSTVFISD